MENFTKELAKRLLRDGQIYGPMLTEAENIEMAEKQAKYLAETAQAEKELDEMLEQARTRKANSTSKT